MEIKANSAFKLSLIWSWGWAWQFSGHWISLFQRTACTATLGPKYTATVIFAKQMMMTEVKEEEKIVTKRLATLWPQRTPHALAQTKITQSEIYSHCHLCKVKYVQSTLQSPAHVTNTYLCTPVSLEQHDLPETLRWYVKVPKTSLIWKSNVLNYENWT